MFFRVEFDLIFEMKSRIEEEIRPVEETLPPKIKKPKGRRKKKTPVDEEIAPIETDEAMVKDSPQERPKSNELANVRCLECHCVGTVMKTIDGIVFFPNKVKKTLLELGGGFFQPKIKYVKPTVKIANNKAKKFVEGFNKVDENEEDGANDGFFERSIKRIQKFKERFTSGIVSARGEKRMELVEMMERLEREKTKTPAKDVPERFTGFFSDEFEMDNFWKSKKRFSLQ